MDLTFSVNSQCQPPYRTQTVQGTGKLHDLLGASHLQDPSSSPDAFKARFSRTLKSLLVLVQYPLTALLLPLNLGAGDSRGAGQFALLSVDTQPATMLSPETVESNKGLTAGAGSWSELKAV